MGNCTKQRKNELERRTRVKLEARVKLVAKATSTKGDVEAIESVGPSSVFVRFLTALAVNGREVHGRRARSFVLVVSVC